MTSATLEHVNYTVKDAEATSAKLCDIFRWKLRWKGPSKAGGTSVHIGTDDRHLALYTPRESGSVDAPTHPQLNHIGVLVDNLEEIELRVIAAGYQPHSHQVYDPGRRFYFHDENGIEYEVVSYSR